MEDVLRKVNVNEMVKLKHLSVCNGLFCAKYQYLR